MALKCKKYCIKYTAGYFPQCRNKIDVWIVFDNFHKKHYKITYFYVAPKVRKTGWGSSVNSENNYLFKFNDRNARIKCEIVQS